MNRGGGRGGRGGRGYSAGRELMKNHYEDLDLDANELNIQSSGFQQKYNSNIMNENEGRSPLPLYPNMELPIISPSLDHIKLIQNKRTLHSRLVTKLSVIIN